MLQAREEVEEHYDTNLREFLDARKLGATSPDEDKVDEFIQKRRDKHDGFDEKSALRGSIRKIASQSRKPN